MTAWAYYNEFDPHAAQWLRNLIDMDLLPAGYVDERSIVDVDPEDLRGFTQHHFFAGIGVWPYAFRLAGWPDDKPVWSGSCPCQGFSSAGKRLGFKDPRHLWPDWFRLIEYWRPREVFGEQVDSSDVIGKSGNTTEKYGPYGKHGADIETENPTTWFDLVQAQMEGARYALGVQVSPAAGYGAPHGRHRTYFVAEKLDDTFGERRNKGRRDYREYDRLFSGANDAAGFMGNYKNINGELFGKRFKENVRRQDANRVSSSSEFMGEPERSRLERFSGDVGNRQRRSQASGSIAETNSFGPLAYNAKPGRKQRQSPQDNSVVDRSRIGTMSDNDFWRDADWIFCRDGKWRPIGPGISPLVNGAAFRMGSGSTYEGKLRQEILKGAGNAIVAWQAKAFIETYLETKGLIFNEQETPLN